MRKNNHENGHIVRLYVHGYDVIALKCAIQVMRRTKYSELETLQRGHLSRHWLVPEQKKHIEELTKLIKYLNSRLDKGIFRHSEKWLRMVKNGKLLP